MPLRMRQFRKFRLYSTRERENARERGGQRSAVVFIHRGRSVLDFSEFFLRRFRRGWTAGIPPGAGGGEVPPTGGRTVAKREAGRRGLSDYRTSTR
jgi:hypothetical protein